MDVMRSKTRIKPPIFEGKLFETLTHIQKQMAGLRKSDFLNSFFTWRIPWLYRKPYHRRNGRLRTGKVAEIHHRHAFLEQLQ